MHILPTHTHCASASELRSYVVYTFEIEDAEAPLRGVAPKLMVDMRAPHLFSFLRRRWFASPLSPPPLYLSQELQFLTLALEYVLCNLTSFWLPTYDFVGQTNLQYGKGVFVFYDYDRRACNYLWAPCWQRSMEKGQRPSFMEIEP